MKLTVDHQATAAEAARRLDAVAAEARQVADDLRAALDSIDALIESAGRLRARIETHK